MLFKEVLWILQFGMLIQHLFEMFPNVEDVNEMAIGDLQVSESILSILLSFKSHPSFCILISDSIIFFNWIKWML